MPRQSNDNVGKFDTLNVGGVGTISGILTITDTTNSTSKDTGCLVLEGGAGIEKDLFVQELKIASADGTSNNNFNIVIGDSNTGLSLTSTAVNNIAIGIDALKTNIVGIQNTAIGKNSLELTTGNSSTAVGSGSLLLSTGNNNTAVGKNAGNCITSGANCVFIGGDADTSLITGNNQIAIGQGAVCDLANQCTIGNADLVILRPGADNKCDLGESDVGYKDVYITGTIKGDPSSSSGAGAVAITSLTHQVSTTGTGDALTLANGYNGQVIHVVYISANDGADTAILTPTTLNGFTTITFGDVGDGCSLVYSTTGGWVITGNQGCTLA